ncbi:odorant receptor 22c-like [Vespula squamosa]|uniref:Odorant receptor 22c-like n=1 Tax=Vespula squamosa TaxID=30214 RepID=A0ABD2C1J6_VESSQ
MENALNRYYMTETTINSPISKLIELGLYFIGLWPNYTYSIIHRILWIVILGIVLILEYRYILLHIATDDLADLMDCFSITVSNSLLFIKLIILWFKQRTFDEIIDMMNEDWLECNTVGRNVDLMTRKVFVAQKFSKISTIIYGGGVIMFLIPVIFAEERIFVLKMEFPFDATVSPFYELINIVQFFQEVTFASTSGMLNGVIMTMILHTGGQVEIMCQTIEEFMNKTDNEHGSYLNILKKLIVKHDKIILFAGYIEELFTYIALLQFFSNTMAICFSGFVIMTSFDMEEGSAILAKTVPYYTVVNVEAFILCFAGEYLSSKSMIIGRKAYDTNWYELKPNESRYILFLILRAQKKLTITVGKFLDLSLESFASILKASASYASNSKEGLNSRIYPNSIIKPVRYTLYFIGLWPDYNYAILHRILWVVALGSILIFQYRYIVIHIFIDDLADLMDCFSITVSNSLLLIKLFILWNHQGTLRDLLLMMKDDWSKTITTTTTITTTISNKFPIKYYDIMIDKIKSLRRFTKFCFFGYSFSAIMFIFPVILSDDRILVLKMELPFDPFLSPIYETVCIVQLIEEIAFAATSGMLNAVIVTMILHVGGQIDVMCQEIKDMFDQFEKNEMSRLKTLKYLIVKHDRIILFSNYIKDMFTYIALLQFFSNTMAICFSGFVIMISMDTDEASAILGKTVPYYVIINIEAFILCYIGEYLSSKSLTIGIAAYDFQWYELKPKESRYILLLILRGQKKLTITVGKFLDLSLESFASILKASASYGSSIDSTMVSINVSPINRLVEFSLRFIGLWPGYSYVIVHRFLWVITMCLTLFFQYWYVVLHLTSGDLPDLMDCLSITMSNSVFFIKLIILWMKNRVFDDILKMMTDDWLDSIDKKENHETMFNRVKLSQRYSKLFVSSYSIGLIFFLSFALFTQEKQLILKMELPFDTTKSPIYELVNIVQFLQEFMATSMSSMLSALLVTLSLDSEQRNVILAKTIPYYVLANLEAFALCYAGEYLSSKSTDIERAAYNSNWYELNPSESRFLLLLMIRSQKRFVITAGKFMDLSLEMFASMLKASGSYVSVLYAIKSFEASKIEEIKYSMLPGSPINRLLELSLCFIGLWPGYSYNIIHRIIWIFAMCFTLIFQFWYLIANFRSGDLPGLMDCLSITISNYLLFIKLIILWIKHRVFSEILKMMTYDWRKCLIEKENIETMTKKVTLSRRYSNFFVGSYSLGVIFFLSFALFAKEKQLILKMELPFDVMESPIYELVNFVQFLEEFIAASTSGMMNALLVTLMLHVDGQVEIICKKFSEISKMAENHLSCKKAFESLIKCHQRVITFTENIENIFSYIALMQFLSNTLSLDSEQRSVILARTIPYYVLVNLEAFVLCFAGEFIKSKSMAIEKAAYKCNWYDLDPKESKFLLLLMMRSQKRFKITAGKFMELSLEGFARMLNASASYVSVLYANQDKMLTSTIGPAVQLGLRCVGVWPNSMMIFPRIFWIVTVSFIQTFQFRYLFAHSGFMELMRIMDSVSLTLAYTITILKLFAFWINYNIFHDILEMMENDWAKSTKIECGHSTMTSKIILAHRYSNLIISVYCISAFFYATGTFIIGDNNYDEGEERELLLKMILPFNSNKSPIYEIVIITQFFHQLLTTAVAAVLSSLIVALILHLGGQVDILCEMLLRISGKDIEGNLSLTILKTAIAKHQRIILFSDNVESLFTYFSLMQFMSNILIICCLGFMIVTSISEGEIEAARLTKSILFYVAIVIEAFVICFAGEYVTAKGKLIGDVAYESLWYDLKPNESRLLLLIILRSQKKLTITAGKIMELSLERFTGIIKASASYISVLLAMY